MLRASNTGHRCLLLLFLLCAAASLTSAYSVLTHEEVVDLLWKDQIEPLLHKRFPLATPDDLRKAHAYAYGGCVIQDMGYYPFGSKDFSDMVHYVRSGDFVMALLTQAQDVNEYAFALGALSHYVADTRGHPAVNHAVALTFPKLRARYGDYVRYADDPKAHIRTEFGFDVAEVAKNRYAPDAYHDFIGFEVSKPLLERAFQSTYGIKLDEVFTSLDLAIGTYRRSVSKMIPEFTKAALLTHQVQLQREIPNFNKKKFVYNLSRAEYEKEWGNDYKRPGTGARILAFLFKIVPKVGLFKAAVFQVPTSQTENMFFGSLNDTLDHYRAYLREAGAGDLRLENRDFDTGKVTVEGEYPLTDKTYASLLHRLADNQFRGLGPALRSELLAFFANDNRATVLKKDKKKWQQTSREIEALRATRAASAISSDR